MTPVWFVIKVRFTSMLCPPVLSNLFTFTLSISIFICMHLFFFTFSFISVLLERVQSGQWESNKTFRSKSIPGVCKYEVEMARCVGCRLMHPSGCIYLSQEFHMKIIWNVSHCAALCLKISDSFFWSFNEKPIPYKCVGT